MGGGADGQIQELFKRKNRKYLLRDWIWGLRGGEEGSAENNTTCLAWQEKVGWWHLLRRGTFEMDQVFRGNYMSGFRHDECELSLGHAKMVGRQLHWGI